MFYNFLVHVKIADYSVTELTFTSVMDLMVVMETDIFTPLLKQTVAAKEVSKG